MDDGGGGGARVPDGERTGACVLGRRAGDTGGPATTTTTTAAARRRRRRGRRWGYRGSADKAGAPRTSRARRSPPTPPPTPRAPYVYYSFCQKLVYEVRINQPELLRPIRTLRRYVRIPRVYLDLPPPKRPGGVYLYLHTIYQTDSRSGRFSRSFFASALCKTRSGGIVRAKTIVILSARRRRFDRARAPARVCARPPFRNERGFHPKRRRD